MIRPVARSIGVLLLSVVLAVGLVIAAVLCSGGVLVGGIWIALVGPKRSTLVQFLELRSKRLSKTDSH